MIAERLGLLTESLHRSMKLEFALVPQFSLVEIEGYYGPASFENPQCHPLETLLLGLPVLDDPKTQIANILGEDRDWVDGFIDQYAGSPKLLGPYRYDKGCKDAANEEIAKFFR